MSEVRRTAHATRVNLTFERSDHCWVSQFGQLSPLSVALGTYREMLRLLTGALPLGSYEKLLFMHNGGIAYFDKIKRKLQSCLSDELFLVPQGNTGKQSMHYLIS